jgi:hypothetical protein
MKWIHKVNPEWLDARRSYLTASDIQKLLPMTPTGRARLGINEVQLKVWAKKQCEITDEDVVSTGAMARGHLLEPYAIAAFNTLGRGTALMHHWDDCLIYSPDGIACSPDSLDIKQSTKMVQIDGLHREAAATMVAEVKCYNAETHYEAGLAHPGMLSERWQLATAFYVMPTIELGVLVFFNPLVKHPLFVHEYTRADLTAELAMIEVVGKSYFAEVLGFTFQADVLCDRHVASGIPTEAGIIEEILATQAADDSCPLNP